MTRLCARLLFLVTLALAFVTTGVFRTENLIVENHTEIGGSATIGSDLIVVGTITQGSNQAISAVGSGLGRSGATAFLNITPTACGVGSAINAINALGSGSCVSAGSTISGLTTNQTVKAASSTSITNGWAGDNGTTWGSATFQITEASGSLTGSGSASFGGAMSSAGITNSGAIIFSSQTIAITATQNNLAINRVPIIRLTHSSGADLTGIAMSGGNMDGTVLFISNGSTTDIIALENEDPGSGSGNRISTPVATETFIEANGGAIMHYEGSGSTGRWRVFAYVPH